MSKLLRKLVDPYVITDGSTFRLEDVDPDDDGGIKGSKEQARALLAEGVDRLRILQEKLYAQDRWGVLVIVQGMDAAGKDPANRKWFARLVMAGAIVDALEELHLEYPQLDARTRKDLEKGRALVESAMKRYVKE